MLRNKKGEIFAAPEFGNDTCDRLRVVGGNGGVDDRGVSPFVSLFGDETIALTGIPNLASRIGMLMQPDDAPTKAKIPFRAKSPVIAEAMQ